MTIRSFLAALAVTTALSLPALAHAGQVTLKTNMRNYGGNGAYLAFYVTDASGKYAGSLWMAGGRTRYYRHLSGWNRATGGNAGEVNGVTGASVGSGRSLDISLDLTDALFDAGYQLHVDAAVEDMRDSPDEIVIPLTAANVGKPVQGRRYIADFTFSR